MWIRLKAKATYACLNYGDARLPRELADRGVAIEGDSARVIRLLLGKE